MKKLWFSKKEKVIAKGIIVLVIRQLKREHPKLIKVDSNLLHFIVYDVAKKLGLPISRGWFKNGKYCPVVDDILIKMGIMDKSQHQLYGDEVPMEKVIECGCHRRSK